MNPGKPQYEFNNMATLIPSMKARFDAFREDDLARAAAKGECMTLRDLIFYRLEI